MENINREKLFLASCIALITTAMTFAIRARLESVFGPEGQGLTLEQIGFAFTPAFWGFTIAMMIGGPLVDSLGINRIRSPLRTLLRTVVFPLASRNMLFIPPGPS